MKDLPAIEGGNPIRADFLDMARPSIGDAEICEVADTLRSGWLTSGPKVLRFEKEFAEYVGGRYAVAVSSGTDALGLSLEAAGIGPGDEVVTTPMTWVAASHQIIRRGAIPVFVDIDREDLNLDAALVEASVTERTKAILPVHFAGRPCNMDAIASIAKKHGLELISDSAHAIETRYMGRQIAGYFGMSAYSFHPMKNITTGEGGMIVTDSEDYCQKLRLLRFHGVDKTARQRHDKEDAGDWDVVGLGKKSLMNELQASIGIHQLAAVNVNHKKREMLAAEYDRLFEDVDAVLTPSSVATGTVHAWHMYNILLDIDNLSISRDRFCAALKQENIGAGIHYYSLHRTSYYSGRYGFEPADYPEASFVSDRILTLPLHPGMDKIDCESVAEAVAKLVRYYRR